jgi:DNA-binding response OmpR family regulator
MAESGVLLVEDDEAIASGLVRVLEAQGHQVIRLARGGQVLSETGPDTGLVILDLGLPDVDGIEVCRRLRAAHPEMAILILTARDQESDVVVGLDAGADDYLVKPFRLSELLARVRAHLRRSELGPDRREPIVAGDLTVDVGARRAWHGDTELVLRPKEFDVLALLASRAGEAVSREQLMAEVWDINWFGSTKTLDMHVLALRQKLGAEAITTVRGVGYRLEGG